MSMDPMGGICMTNDGNAILREIIVQQMGVSSLFDGIESGTDGDRDRGGGSEGDRHQAVCQGGEDTGWGHRGL